MTTELSLSVEHIGKTYAGTEDGARAINDVTFSIADGEFYTLLGPSGCGKTTTLRCVAGLEHADTGTIVLGGRVVSSQQPKIFVRPDERDIGMVFQSYAIWPHMTVFENVAFPLRATSQRRRMPRGDVRAYVLDVLETVQLAKFADRLATKLSGGQQQRLALARALALKPRLLLLDEPLSNLDASLRELMRAELRRLQRSAKISTLYVTHDQTEALSMSNRVAVMEGGRIVQEGTPRDIYRRPTTDFVATFVGRTNLLDAEVIGDGDNGSLRLDTPAGMIFAVCPEGTQNRDRISVSIRPEDIRLHAERRQVPGRTILDGLVQHVFYLGESVEYHVEVGKTLLITRAHPDIDFRRHQQISVELPIEHCIVVTAENGVTGPISPRKAEELELETA
jgi:iron(III) transport system ATP-binding protein